MALVHQLQEVELQERQLARKYGNKYKYVTDHDDVIELLGSTKTMQALERPVAYL